MCIKDVLPQLGINDNMIEDVIGNLQLSVDKGYEIRKQDIRTYDAIQMVTIYPKVDWTDGTCRPAYITGYVAVTLNVKI